MPAAPAARAAPDAPAATKRTAGPAPERRSRAKPGSRPAAAPVLAGPSRSPRVERRRASTRDRVLEVAARRFAAVGPERVSLEEIADEADIARGTLYSHFPTKESLIDEVLRPVLERAAERGAAAADLAPGEAIDRLLRLYLELWRDFPYRLRLTYRMSERSLGGQAATHQRFLGAVLRIFESAAGQGKLRAGDAHLAARTLSAVAVPLLELFDGRPGGDALFIETMRSALLRGVERPDGAISC